MGQWMRLKTLLSANLNALLEQAENPEKLLRLLIQQMEEASDQLRKQIIVLSEHEHSLRTSRNGAASEPEAEALTAQLDATDQNLRKLCRDQLQLEDRLHEARQHLLGLKHRKPGLQAERSGPGRSTRLDKKMARTDARMQRFQKKLGVMEAEIESFELFRPRKPAAVKA